MCNCIFRFNSYYNSLDLDKIIYYLIALIDMR